MDYFLLTKPNGCIQHMGQKNGKRIQPVFVDRMEAVGFAALHAAEAVRVGEAPFIGETLQSHIDLAAEMGVATYLFKGGQRCRIDNVAEIASALAAAPSVGRPFLN